MIQFWGRSPAFFVAPFFLFSAFLLLLLVSLSLPIIKPIYLLEIAANLDSDKPTTTLATALDVGIWGYCFRNRKGGLFFDDYVVCSKPEAGYTIDPILLRLFGNVNLANVILKALLAFLVIHPVSCGLTFLTIVPALLRAFKKTTPHFLSILTLLIAILPAILTSIVFILDIAVVIIARSRVYEETKGGLNVYWGPAVWMTGVAAFCLWIGVIGLSAVACGCCGCGWRERYTKETPEVSEKSQPIA